MKITMSGSIPIALTAPDITPIALDAPAAAVIGETIAVSWTGRNDGSVPALGGWRDAIYVSNDDKYSSDDVFLGYQSHSSSSTVSAGGTYDASRSVFLNDLTAGDKFLLLRLDYSRQQGETNEDNNVLAVPITLDAPDLVIDDVTAPESINLDEPFEISWTVTNAGSVPAPANWTDYVYLAHSTSENSTVTSLTTQSISSQTPLPAGESYTITKTLTVTSWRPEADHLMVIVDRNRQQGETNENNNVLAIPITQTAPDLVVTQLTAPDSATIGDEIEVSWTVENQGTGAATRFWVDRIGLSIYSSSADSMASFGSSDIIPLQPGEQYVVTETITIPETINSGYNGAAGSRFLVLHADRDSRQRESNENNNRKSLPIAILPADVDLQVTVNGVPSEVVAGQRLQFDYTVTNFGTADAGSRWHDYVYISDDELLDSADIFLTNFVVNPIPLPAAANYTQSVDVSLASSITPGQKFLLVSTDRFNTQGETDDTNNLVVAPLDIRAPNLNVIDASAPASAVVGQTISVNYTVKNIGDVGAPANWTDYVYLSSDQRYGSGDTFVTSISTSHVSRPLEADSSYTIQQDIQIPSTLTGDRFVLFVTDLNEQQLETNELDNVAAVPITLTAPDLVVSAAEAPTSGVGGQSIDVTFTVTNQGDGPAVADWTDQVYLSNNALFDSHHLLSVDASDQSPLAQEEVTRSRAPLRCRPWAVARTSCGSPPIVTTRRAKPTIAITRWSWAST